MPAKWKQLAFALGVVILAAAIWFAYWHATLEPSSGALTCISNLKVIGEAAVRWSTTSGGLTPPSLRALMDKEGFATNVLICPHGGSKPQPGKFICDYDSVFDRAGHSVNIQQSEAMMVWDKKLFFPRGGEPCRHVLFMDGTIEALGEPDFQKALQALDEMFPPKAQGSPDRMN